MNPIVLDDILGYLIDNYLPQSEEYFELKDNKHLCKMNDMIFLFWVNYFCF